MILPPRSQIGHHHKVTNITMSPTSLSPILQRLWTRVCGMSIMQRLHLKGSLPLHLNVTFLAQATRRQHSTKNKYQIPDFYFRHEFQAQKMSPLEGTIES